MRVDGSCSALGLELALRRGLGLGVGFKVQVKVNKNRSMRYLMGFMSCVGHARDPWPPQHQPHHLVATAPIPIRTRQPSPPPPYQTIPLGGAGGVGNASRLTIHAIPLRGQHMRNAIRKEAFHRAAVGGQELLPEGFLCCHPEGLGLGPYQLHGT